MFNSLHDMFHLRLTKSNYLLSLLVSALAPLAISSCSSQTDEPTTVENKDYTFIISLGSPNSSSSDILNEMGTYEENYIDPNNLQIFIVKKKAGENYGGQTGMSLLQITELDRLSTNTYGVVTNLDEVGLPETDYFSIVICANWPYDSDSRNKANPAMMCIVGGGEYPCHYGSVSGYIEYSGANSYTTYTADQAVIDYRDADGNDTYYTPSTETPMPMYGQKAYTKSDFAGQTHFNLGTVTLIRAMAKLVVNCTSSDVELNAAKMKYSYDVGMCGPTDMYEDTGTQEVNSSVNNIVNIPLVFTTGYNKGLNNQNPLRIIEDVPFKKYYKRIITTYEDIYGNIQTSVTEDSRSGPQNIIISTSYQSQYVIYVPSYNNVAGFDHIATFPSCINLYGTKHNADGTTEETTYTIEFKDDDGNAYNLCRNYMYVYDVFLYGNLLKYSVVPWNYSTQQPIYFQ
jgi:hypothetical protein